MHKSYASHLDDELKGEDLLVNPEHASEMRWSCCGH